MAKENLKQNKESQEALWQELNESESEKVAGGFYYYDPIYVITDYFNTFDPYGSLIFDYDY